jgi:outer membrane protein assembly factor BamB
LSGVLSSGVAAAGTATGTVFLDEDANGVLSAGDTPVANAMVWVGAHTRVKTGADGRFSVAVAADEILWVRTPDGLAPYPAWRPVTAAGGELDLALVRNPARGTLRFVQGSDTHIGAIEGAAAAKAIASAGGVLPLPYFLVLTGDLTQGNGDAEFQVVTAAVADLAVPFVSVPGNHDYYDGGANYRKYMGPTTYSFDAGGTHFVVLESTDPGVMLPFLDADLADVAPGTPLVAFLHYPPASEGDAVFVDGLRSRGVTRLFTGHLHRNRRFDYDGVLDYNMSPMVMAGVDYTPGGYRVVTLDGATVAMTFHTSVEAPVLRLLHPLDGACVPGRSFQLIAAAESGGAPVAVQVRIDGGLQGALEPAGGWTYVRDVTVTEGMHAVELISDDPRMGPVEAHFCVESRAAPAVVGADWPQLQGGPQHTGATGVEVMAPLEARWARSVGGHLRGGSPVLSGGRLFVSVVDPGDGARGGVVALDAITGEPLWETRLGRSVHNAPAAAGDLVVAATEDGVVHALAVDTGVERWGVNLSAGLPGIGASLTASPTIADGVVYIGVVGNFAAIDLATGTLLWQLDPAPGAHVDATDSSVAVEEGVVVGMFGYGAARGLAGFDAATGERLWELSGELSVAGAISPVVADGRVYAGNGASDLYAADLTTGDVVWQVKLSDGGGAWSYLLGATPAVSGGRLFVPTHAEWLFALSKDSGSALWAIGADESVLHPVHYQSTVRSFASSPVVTGNVLWAGGADGRLRAVDIPSGELIWSVDLGSPVLSGPVPASPYLYIGTWDGTMRALATKGELPPPAPKTGCSVGGGGGFTLLLLVGFAAVLPWWRRRRVGKVLTPR